MIKNEGSIFIEKKNQKYKQWKLVDNLTFPTNYHYYHQYHLTHDFMNQFPVSTKSAGEEYGFTQELFNILLQTDKCYILSSSSSSILTAIDVEDWLHLWSYTDMLNWVSF